MVHDQSFGYTYIFPLIRGIVPIYKSMLLLRDDCGYHKRDDVHAIPALERHAVELTAGAVST
jgi:hypothetical protein